MCISASSRISVSPRPRSCLFVQREIRARGAGNPDGLLLSVQDRKAIVFRAVPEIAAAAVRVPVCHSVPFLLIHYYSCPSLPPLKVDSRTNDHRSCNNTSRQLASRRARRAATIMRDTLARSFSGRQRQRGTKAPLSPFPLSSDTARTTAPPGTRRRPKCLLRSDAEDRTRKGEKGASHARSPF